MASRIASFILILATITLVYLTFTQIDLISPAEGAATEQRIKLMIILFNLVGSLCGIVLCPIFLPTPDKTKKPLCSVAFIILLFLPNLIIRFLGADFWLGKAAAPVIMSTSSGMFYPLVFGLFFMSRRQRAQGYLQNPVCALELTAAILTAMVIRYFSVPFLEYFFPAADPAQALSFIFAINKLLVIIMLVSAVCCVLFMPQSQTASAAQAVPRHETGRDSPPDGAPVTRKTNKGLILRLISLSLVFAILNSLIDQRLWPLAFGVKDGYMFFLPAVIPAVLLLACFSHKRLFLRYFLFTAVALFILLPYLTLLHNPLLIIVLSSLAAILNFSKWSIFSVFITENYKGGFWFYACASSIHITNILSFVSSIFSPLIPDTTGTMVLLSAVAAVVFATLSFKLLAQDDPRSVPAARGETLNLVYNKPLVPITESFTAHKLTRRETEIAELVFNGLSNGEIGECLFITESTVKKNMTAIFEKYHAKSRSDFMSKVTHECGLLSR